MYVFHIPEYKILTNPLKPLLGCWRCWLITSPDASIWFAQYWHSGKPVSLRTFYDAKEFNMFYNKLKKIYKNEKQENNIPCYDVRQLDENHIPF